MQAGFLNPVTLRGSWQIYAADYIDCNICSTYLYPHFP